MNLHTGRLDAAGMRFAVVVSRFNDFVARRLLEGAVESLLRHGAASDDIDVYWVPGSFEIPFAAQEVAAAGNVDAIICLGVVVRGETPHFEFVAGESAGGVFKVGMESRVPTVFGVVTTETLEQAIDRAGGKHGNKGADVAAAAVEMVQLTRDLRSRGSGATPRVVDDGS